RPRRRLHGIAGQTRVHGDVAPDYEDSQVHRRVVDEQLLGAFLNQLRAGLVPAEARDQHLAVGVLQRQHPRLLAAAEADQAVARLGQVFQGNHAAIDGDVGVQLRAVVELDAGLGHGQLFPEVQLEIDLDLSATGHQLGLREADQQLLGKDLVSGFEHLEAATGVPLQQPAVDLYAGCDVATALYGLTRGLVGQRQRQRAQGQPAATPD